MLGTDGKIILVYANINVTDKESMSIDWWTECILSSDTAWHNQVDMYMLSFIKETNLYKNNYENGKQYEVIFPFMIDSQQVTYINNVDVAKWKYKTIWSQNPIIYSELK